MKDIAVEGKGNQWILKTLGEDEELNTRFNDFSEMKGLWMVSNNVAEPLNVEVVPLEDSAIEITETYKRYSSVEGKVKLKKLLMESLDLLVECNETKMILPNVISYDIEGDTFKFIIVTKSKNMIPNAYPILNWGFTIFCFLFSVDWKTAILKSEKTLKNKENYEKYLKELFGHKLNEDTKLLFDKVMNYENLWRNQNIRSFKQQLFAPSISSKLRTACALNCLTELERDMGAPYILLECEHTLTRSKAKNIFYYKLFAKDKSIWIKCDECYSITRPKQIRLECGCIIKYDDSIEGDKCRCKLLLLRMEDRFYMNGKFTDESKCITTVNDVNKLEQLPFNTEAIRLTLSATKEFTSIPNLINLYSLELTNIKLTDNNMKILLDSCEQLRILSLSIINNNI